MDIKEYKCRNCGGAVIFDGRSQSIICAHCESRFDISEFDGGKENCAESGVTGVIEDVSMMWEDPDADGMEAGRCPSCGAELFRCKNAVAMVCPYCDNAEISITRLSGMLKPDYVIPFKLVKKNAVAALKRFCRDKYLLPDDYLAQKRIDDMQGVYVPFWLFDADVTGYTNDDILMKMHRGNVSLSRLTFEKIPVDGSVRMDDDYTDAIEPFYYGGMKPFAPAYLAGYLAEKYDVGLEESKARAVRRIRGTFATQYYETIPANVQKEVNDVVGKDHVISIDIKDAKEYYALFPIWVFNAKYNGETYRFMVNGQTGRLAGKLPIDKSKVKKFTALFTAAYGTLFTSLALVTLRQPVAALFYGRDQWGFDGQETLLAPIGHLIDALSSIKIPLIAGLWGVAFWLASKIIKNWKARMNTIGEKTEACHYVRTHP